MGAAISSSLADGELVKAQACFLPLSPDGTPAIGPVPGTNDTLFVASGKLPSTSSNPLQTGIFNFNIMT